MVVTGLTRNQLYLFWYRGFESHRLRHIMARCEPQNKKATSVAFFILLLFARHYNCSDGGRPKYVTLDFHLAIPSLRSLRIPRLYHSVAARRHITRQAKRLPFLFTPATPLPQKLPLFRDCAFGAKIIIVVFIPIQFRKSHFCGERGKRR